MYVIHPSPFLPSRKHWCWTDFGTSELAKRELAYSSVEQLYPLQHYLDWYPFAHDIEASFLSVLQAFLWWRQTLNGGVPSH